MKELLSKLKANPKVDYIDIKHEVSLDDIPPIKNARVVLKTRFNKFEWAKSIDVTPSQEENKVNVNFYIGATDPNKSLLSEIYNRCKIKEWESAKFGHDKPSLDLCVDETDFNKILNWFYSVLN